MKYLAKFTETNCKEVLIEGKSQAEAKKELTKLGVGRKELFDLGFVPSGMILIFDERDL